MTARWVLDSSYRRPGDGRTIIAGSPLRLFRVSDAALDGLRALERGEPVPTQLKALVERLVDAGAVHPVPATSSAAASPGNGAGELTIVLPARDHPPRLRASRCRSIVVDDASVEPLSLHDVEVLRLDTNVGPGGARNAALSHVETPYVAFVDSDVDADEDDLLALVAHLVDPRVALVAPRVTGSSGDGVLERYEATRSPLALGTEPARVAPGTRVSFVPAAAIVCRTEAVRAVGGFDESLRYGEDVDLVWRLVAAGWRCRYEPSIVVRHRTRATLAAWTLQRERYGASAAPLAARHPGALAPVRMSGWSALTWAAIVGGAPAAGFGIGALTTLALIRKLRDVPAREAVRLAGLGHLYAGRLLVSTLLRAWWPIAFAAALVSHRARRILGALAVGLAVADRRAEGSSLDVLRYLALRRLDDVAYGAGVWLGAARHRTLEPLLPSFTPWPPR
jgi:mycofactocin system glycosyltransferase